MPNSIHFLLSSLLFIAIIFLSACGTTQPAYFYILNPTEEAKTPLNIAAAQTGPIISLGPIEIPEYLKRPQIVSYIDRNQLKADDFHRWAESLESNVSRVIAINLGNLIPTDRIVIFPWNRLRLRPNFDYRISIQVVRFDTKNSKVTLRTRWILATGDGSAGLAVKQFFVEEPVLSPGYDAIVAAHSAALAKLSIDIANKIKEVSKSNQ